MPVLCYEMKSANQLVCGEHRVPLVKNRIPIDSNAPGLGQVTCYVCPVSQSVAQEAKVSHAQK